MGRPTGHPTAQVGSLGRVFGSFRRVAVRWACREDPAAAGAFQRSSLLPVRAAGRVIPAAPPAFVGALRSGERPPVPYVVRGGGVVRVPVRRVGHFRAATPFGTAAPPTVGCWHGGLSRLVVCPLMVAVACAFRFVGQGPAGFTFHCAVRQPFQRVVTCHSVHGNERAVMRGRAGGCRAGPGRTRRRPRARCMRPR